MHINFFWKYKCTIVLYIWAAFDTAIWILSMWFCIMKNDLTQCKQCLKKAPKPPFTQRKEKRDEWIPISKDKCKINYVAHPSKGNMGSSLCCFSGSLWEVSICRSALWVWRAVRETECIFLGKNPGDRQGSSAFAGITAWNWFSDTEWVIRRLRVGHESEMGKKNNLVMTN